MTVVCPNHLKPMINAELNFVGGTITFCKVCPVAGCKEVKPWKDGPKNYKITKREK